LSQLDEQTAGMYPIVVSSGSPAATISVGKSAQGRFLARRNACEANVDRLVSAYTDQMMCLKNEKSNLGSPAVFWSDAPRRLVQNPDGAGRHRRFFVA